MIRMIEVNSESGEFVALQFRNYYELSLEASIYGAQRKLQIPYSLGQSYSFRVQQHNCYLSLEFAKQSLLTLALMVLFSFFQKSECLFDYLGSKRLVNLFYSHLQNLS